MPHFAPTKAAHGRKYMTDIKDIELFMLDMDGTLYLGEQVIKGAVEFIDRIKAKGARVMFFTNNASKDRSLYIEKLHRLGFNAEISEIVSSGDVTAAFLNNHRPGKKVYLMGTPACEKPRLRWKRSLTSVS